MGAPVLCFLLIAEFFCTNYSGQEQVVNPVVLLEQLDLNGAVIATAIEVEGSGHIIHVRAQNQEIGFAGYRLYTKSTLAELQNTDTADGTDCGLRDQLPNQSIQYIIEVKPDQTLVTSGSSNRLCNVRLALTSGYYVMLRSLILKTPTSVGTSTPSNTMVVP